MSARTSLEDLATMPGDMLTLRSLFVSERLSDRLTAESAEHLRDNGPPCDLLRHFYSQVLSEGEASEIEDLVMQGAECQAIRDLVWAMGLEPSDVRSLESDVHSTEMQIQAADRAASLVCSKNGCPELRIPPSAGRRGHRGIERFGEGQADRGRDVRSKRRGEMGCQEKPGDPATEGRIPSERLEDPV